MQSVLDELRGMFGDKVIDDGLADGSIVAYDIVEPMDKNTWTTEYPTKPGWYWLKNCHLGRWPDSISKPIIVRIDHKQQCFLDESNLPWFRSDIVSAEWYGPILPPE